MWAAFLAGWGSMSFAQSVYPGQYEEKFNVKTCVPMAAECFDLQDVRLLPSRFRENMERDSAGWFLSRPTACCIASALRRECTPGAKEAI